MSPDIFVDQLGGDRQAEMMSCFTSLVDNVDGFMRTPPMADRLRFYQSAQAFAIEIALQVRTDNDPLLYFLGRGLGTLDYVSPSDRRIVKPLLDRARRAILINTD